MYHKFNLHQSQCNLREYQDLKIIFKHSWLALFQWFVFLPNFLFLLLPHQVIQMLFSHLHSFLAYGPSLPFWEMVNKAKQGENFQYLK